mmetsp:Transcript_35611/g.94216  ORF Transcript_35611/g.94216 Transcript_35611/m.94216 type:complete len:393 (-) Transcript_35611:1635-2813(-)
MRSSKVARKQPLVPSAFLISPLMPLTVWIFECAYLATSRSELNMFLTKAVFLKILYGSPTSFNFFTMLKFGADSRTPPVAAMRKWSTFFQLRKAMTPAFGGTMGPYMVMVQCACSSVYFKNLILFSPLSSSENVGTVWYRRQPTESSRASLLFSNFGCHRCRFTRTCTRPMEASPGSKPPKTSSLPRSISATQAAGTSSSRTRTKVAMGMLSEKASTGSMLAAADAFAGAALLEEPPPSPPTPLWPSSSPPSPSSPSAPAAFAAAALGSPSSSSSALLQPPVMNFRVFKASFRSSSQGRSPPGSFGIRAVSKPSKSPRLPNNPPLSRRPSASSPPANSSSSSSSSSKSGTVLWSVGPPDASFPSTAAPSLSAAFAFPEGLLLVEDDAVEGRP